MKKTSDDRKQVHIKTQKQTNRVHARAQKFERKTPKYYLFGKLPPHVQNLAFLAMLIFC